MIDEPLPLRTLMSPASVGVLGVAPDDHSKPGNRFVQRLIADGYDGDVHLLGRTAGQYLGLPIHTDPEALPEGIDVVLSAMGPKANAVVLPAIAQRKARNAIIFSAGYAEMGTDGQALEHQLLGAAREHGMRIVGPNCLGMFNTAAKVNLTSFGNIPAGPIGLISQSGNVALTILDHGIARNLGFSTFVSFGNQADVEVHEMVAALGHDDTTEVIVVYLEGLRAGSGPKLLDVCRQVSAVKPIVAIKGGRTSAGQRAAASHTAALSTDATLYRSLFRQAGVIEVDHLEHLYDVAEALVRCPPMTSRDVAIVGSGGGHSTIASDELEFAGLRVPEFDASLQQRAHTVLPAHAPVRNPIDMTGQYGSEPSLFATLTSWVFDAEPGFGGALNYGLFGTWGRVETHGGSPTASTQQLAAAAQIGKVARDYQRPIIFYTPCANQDHALFRALRQAGVPCVDDLSAAAAALRALAQRGEQLQGDQRDGTRRILAHGCESPTICATASVSGIVDEVASLAWLANHGVPVVAHAVAPDAATLTDQAEGLGYPVVAKAVVAGEMHKSELGVVALGLADASALSTAYGQFGRQLAAAGIDWDGQAIVARDLGRNDELIFGARRDEIFGTVLLVGVGGIDAETLGDVAVIIPPFDVSDVQRAISGLRGAGIFAGRRGRPGIDINEVTSVLAGLEGLVANHPQVAEVDVNPVMVVDGHLVAVDASIRMVSPPGPR